MLKEKKEKFLFLSSKLTTTQQEEMYEFLNALLTAQQGNHILKADIDCGKGNITYKLNANLSLIKQILSS